MSDDEEILFKGKDLYAHLVDQGFSDFDTYTTVSTDDKEHLLTNDLVNEHDISYSFKSGVRDIKLSIHDQYRFSTLIKSQLLFKEDVDIIQSILSNYNISTETSNMIWYVGLGCASLLSSAVLLCKGVHYYIPFSITIFFSMLTSWECLKQYREFNRSNKISSYINTLQSLCSNTHKILRHLKETEIIAKCQTPMHNIYASKNMEISKNENLEQLPSWISLPSLRQYVVKSLFDIIRMLLHTNHSLNQDLPSWLHEISDESLTENFRSKSLMLESERYTTLKDIYLLNELYLLCQSENLKLMTLCISSVVWENSLNHKSKAIETVLKGILEIERTFKQISFALMMKFNIHSIYSSPNGKDIANNLSRTKPKATNNLYFEVHNIFLLMLSLMLKVRSLEDDLENSIEVTEHSSNVNTILIKQLYDLKEDFIHTEKYFDSIMNENMMHGTNNINVRDGESAVAEYKTKETGIVVGSSDFKISVADEVFLAMSGLIGQEDNKCYESMYFEKKPLIPKDFMLELSNTLKVRKKDFSEREKIALIKKGLNDIELDDSASSDEGSSRFSYQLQEQNEPSSKSSNNSNTLNSDLMSYPPTRKSKYQTRKLLNEGNSSDESSEELNFNNKYTCVNSALAEVIAMKSLAWGNTKEEYFSDN